MATFGFSSFSATKYNIEGHGFALAPQGTVVSNQCTLGCPATGLPITRRNVNCLLIQFGREGGRCYFEYFWRV